MVLAERSFLWWRTSEWEAVGVWATAFLTVFALVFAVVQIRQAARDRHETTRPFVQVDVDPRGFIAYVSIKNPGQTAASNVKVVFDVAPERAHQSDLAWLEAPALKDGIPLLAPGRELRFFFDSFIERHESTLPSRYDGTVHYGAHGRGDQYEDRFILDLGMYMESAVGDHKMHDLVEEIEKFRKEVAKWTESGHLRVLVQDREIRSRRDWRRHHQREMKRMRSNGGRTAVMKYHAKVKLMALQEWLASP